MYVSVLYNKLFIDCMDLSITMYVSVLYNKLFVDCMDLSKLCVASLSEVRIQQEHPVNSLRVLVRRTSHRQPQEQ